MEAKREGIIKEREEKIDITQLNELESNKQSTMCFQPVDLWCKNGVTFTELHPV